MVQLGCEAEAEAVYRKAMGIDTKAFRACYHLCCLKVKSESETALSLLRQVGACNASFALKRIEDNPVLDPLRALPAFPALVAALERMEIKQKK